MMMLHHDNRHPKSKMFVLIVISIVFVYSITRPASVAFVSETVMAVVEPISVSGNNSMEAAARTGGLFGDKSELVTENLKLKEDILSLSLKLVDRNLLAEENLRLKELLGRDKIENKLIASVLTNDSVSPYGTVLLDVGALDGVAVGDEVLSGRVVLGTIVRITDNGSLMQPYATPGEKLDVLVGDATTVAAVAVGRGGGNYIIEVPRDTDVAVGDMVTLPGLNPLIVGTVEHIAIQSNDPFKHLLFKAPVSLRQLRYVEIKLDTINNIQLITEEDLNANDETNPI